MSTASMSRDAASGALGPARRSGPTRVRSNGSVSSRTPSSSMSTVEWPTNVNRAGCVRSVRVSTDRVYEPAGGRASGRRLGRLPAPRARRQRQVAGQAAVVAVARVRVEMHARARHALGLVTVVVPADEARVVLLGAG